MAVGLYTSRIILQALGVMDFGIYNVVGGVVTMFGFINSSLSGASSRFITFALGRGDINELKRIQQYCSDTLSDCSRYSDSRRNCGFMVRLA